MSASKVLTEKERKQRVANMRAFNERRRALTHCANGHEFTPENTKWDKDGHRHCRVCHRQNNKDLYQRRRVEYWAKLGLHIIDPGNRYSWLQCRVCKKKSPRTNPGKQNRHWELCPYYKKD